MATANPIRNQLFSSAIRDLRLPCPCDISQYVVQVQGVTAAGRKTFLVRIHACAVRPLQGAHKVSMEGGEPFWVQSLTAFKKNFFGFIDSLSFERSMYLVADPALLRLQNIRFIVTLPQTPIQEGERVYRTHMDFTTKMRRRSLAMGISTHTQRRKRLILTRSVEKLLRLYASDGESTIESVQTLTTDFQEACANVLASMRTYRPVEELAAEETDPEILAWLYSPDEGPDETEPTQQPPQQPQSYEIPWEPEL